MPRFRFFLVVLSCLFLTRIAAADTGREDYLKAQTAFEALVSAAVAKGEMPRKSDPVARSLLAVLSDEDRKFGTPEFPADEFASDVCFAAKDIANTYFLFRVNERLEESGIDIFKFPYDQIYIFAAANNSVRSNFLKYNREALPLSFFRFIAWRKLLLLRIDLWLVFRMTGDRRFKNVG